MQFIQLLISGVAQGCIYGLIALGFVLIYKATEIVSFAQGELMMVGAFIGVAVMAWLGFPFWLAVIASMAAMALLGLLLERLVIRPVLGQPAFSIVMLTIGIGYLLRGLVTMIPGIGTETRTLAVPYKDATLHWGGLIVGAEQLVVIVATMLLCALLFAMFRYTRLGVAMQAASQNQLAAYYMGIPVKIIFSLIWAISAAVAAAAGVLLAPIATIDPNMGFIGLKAFAAAVIGGFGSLPGAVIAGLMLGAIEPFAAAYGSRAGLPKGVPEVSSYIFMLVVLIVRPQGLFAQIYKKKV